MRQNLLLLVSAVGEPASSLAKGGFLVSKDFYSHQQSWWFICAKASKQRTSVFTREN